MKSSCRHLVLNQYDTIRYDSVYLTGSEKLTGSQLSLPHGINKKLTRDTKNKKMSVIMGTGDRSEYTVESY